VRNSRENQPRISAKQPRNWSRIEHTIVTPSHNLNHNHPPHITFTTTNNGSQAAQHNCHHLHHHHPHQPQHSTTTPTSTTPHTTSTNNASLRQQNKTSSPPFWDILSAQLNTPQMLTRVCTLNGKVGGANKKLCERMEGHSSTTSRSVEDKGHAKRHTNHTRNTRETTANPVEAHICKTRKIARNSPLNSVKQPRNSVN
jgi:hypothetical protein